MILRSGKEFENFRVSARRQYKTFPMTSGELNVEVGAYIQPIVNKPVKLKGAGLEIYIEIVKGMAYVGVDRISGHGGLPVGVSETAVSLLSSGIDSPVSSFEMIKRGVDLTYVHFHSAPSTSRQSIKNVKKLLKILARYQLSCPLHLIPLLEIQQKIMSESHDKYWVLLFRRAMIRLSCMIAEKIDAPVLISGESVGQVASQTLSNIRATADVGDRPILRPLAGMNKEEIITRAKIIGTYEVSIEPYQDCCSFFVPAHPETKARLNIIQNVEERIQFGDLFEKAISAGEFEIISIN
jgi:thiamine biosynthesis protein ThiI